jgi:hypothetical protein
VQQPTKIRPSVEPGSDCGLRCAPSSPRVARSNTLRVRALNMCVCYLRDDNEIDAARCRTSLRDRWPIALSTFDSPGRVAYVIGLVRSVQFDPNRAVGMRWRVEIDLLTAAALSSLPPVLESVPSQGRVDGAASDRSMPELSRDRAHVIRAGAGNLDRTISGVSA